MLWLGLWRACEDESHSKDKDCWIFGILFDVIFFQSDKNSLTVQSYWSDRVASDHLRDWESKWEQVLVSLTATNRRIMVNWWWIDCWYNFSFQDAFINKNIDAKNCRHHWLATHRRCGGVTRSVFKSRVNVLLGNVTDVLLSLHANIFNRNYICVSPPSDTYESLCPQCRRV